MWRIAVCNGNAAEREQLLGYIRRFCEERNMALAVHGAADWPELFEQLKEAEPDIIIVAQDGVDGLNTITGIHVSPGKFIWFSDLDFAVQAYRLCVGWFGKKPVAYRQMEQALLRCMETACRKQGGNENETK